MADITLAQAQAKLQTWLDAEDRIARAQSYTTGDGRTLTRANLAEVRRELAFWRNEVRRLDRGGIIIKQAVPLDT